jgi:hypothetical protein
MDTYINIIFNSKPCTNTIRITKGLIIFYEMYRISFIIADLLENTNITELTSFLRKLFQVLIFK